MPFDKTGRIVSAKTRMPQVVTVVRKRQIKKPATPNYSKQTVSIEIANMVVEGTRHNIIVFTFNRQLSEPEKTKIEELIASHDCYEMITGRVWRSNEMFRISIKVKFVCECGCRDIRQMMREIVQGL